MVKKPIEKKKFESPFIGCRLVFPRMGDPMWEMRRNHMLLMLKERGFVNLYTIGDVLSTWARYINLMDNGTFMFTYSGNCQGKEWKDITMDDLKKGSRPEQKTEPKKARAPRKRKEKDRTIRTGVLVRVTSGTYTGAYGVIKRQPEKGCLRLWVNVIAVPEDATPDLKASIWACRYIDISAIEYSDDKLTIQNR